MKKFPFTSEKTICRYALLMVSKNTGLVLRVGGVWFPGPFIGIGWAQDSPGSSVLLQPEEARVMR
jgi:hypothetical protein